MSARDLPDQADPRVGPSGRTLGTFGESFVDPSWAVLTPMEREQRRADLHENAIERAAIAWEGCLAPQAPGLVSTPTSQTPTLRLAPSVLAARALLSATGAVMLDPGRKRLSDLRKIIGASARGLLAAADGRPMDVIMLTFTYAAGVEWSPRHISACTDAMRKWFARKGVPFRYLWVAELQERGALHYHAALFVPQGFKVPFADERGWWPHGMTRTELARDAVAYLMSYLGKEDQKDYSRLPKGARAYGVGGLEECFKRVNRWLRAPAFVRRLSSIDDGWRRAPAGGVMVQQATGVVFERVGAAGPMPLPPGRLVQVIGGWIAPNGRHFVSEFRRVMVASVAAVVRVAQHDMTDAMPEGVGPFSWISRAKGVHA
jgi:hypothetical protein